MSFRFNTVQEEDEWEIITADWWRTAFFLVPWTYIPAATEGKPSRRQFYGSLFAGLSSQYAPRDIYSDDVQCKFSSEDDTLNPELVGANGAIAAVASYEEDVGFSCSICPKIEPHELNLFTHVDLSLSIDENDVSKGRQRWKELVEGLMNGESTNTDNSGSLASSLIGSFFSTGSDDSVDSFVMPSTPKPKHSFTDVEVKASSPNGSVDGSGFDNPAFLSPGKSLNAAASSFVPTFSQSNDEAIHFPPSADTSKSSSPTPSFANFTFPTLNAPSQAPQATVKFKKDDQGFFTEVQNEPPNTGESANLLPPFLQESSHRNRTRKSRTREIVDRLRSQTSPDDTSTSHFPFSNRIELSPKYASHSPSPIRDDRSFVIPRLSVSEDGGDRASGLSTPSLEDDDGWVSQPNTSSPRHKAKRTRELFLALTRRRTDSLSSENLKALMDSADDSSTLPPRNISAPPSPSPQTLSPLMSNDGWIESNVTSPEPQKKLKPSLRESHRRKKSFTHNTSSRASLSASSTSSRIISTTSTCFSSLHPTVSPHMAPQAIPYFFPAYPTVATPVPYTAFMHFPTFPIGMPMHGHTGLPVNSTSTLYGTNPALISRRGGSMKPPMTSGTITNMTPTYMAKQSPLW